MEIEKLLMDVLFRCPDSPRNAVGETRRDSLPIVLALSSECGRALNHLLAKSVDFEAIQNVTPREEASALISDLSAFSSAKERASNFAK